MLRKVFIFLLLQAFAFAGVYEMAAKVFSEAVSTGIAIAAFGLFNYALYKWLTPKAVEEKSHGC